MRTLLVRSLAVDTKLHEVLIHLTSALNSVCRGVRERGLDTLKGKQLLVRLALRVQRSVDVIEVSKCRALLLALLGLEVGRNKRATRLQGKDGVVTLPGAVDGEVLAKRGKTSI